MSRTSCVYILASGRHGTLYTGVTTDLVSRVWEHKQAEVPGFTKRYRIDRLVWFEATDNIEAAIIREKQIKRWRRDWKIALIEKNNPERSDLFLGLAP